MQRRRISADIVTNPSTTERKSHNNESTTTTTHHILGGDASFPPHICERNTTSAPLHVKQMLSLEEDATSHYPSPADSHNSHDSAKTSHAQVDPASGSDPLPCAPLTLKHSVSDLGSGQPAQCNASSPPRLSKESAKQYSYVDSLVDVASTITNTLWPCPKARSSSKSEHSYRMLSYFITETSRKSKTSLSTMQLALLYCIRFKRDQENLRRMMDEHSRVNGLDSASISVGSLCARRNFLSALILASKYLQDRNFSNKAWSKISSVSVAEINLREREFLEITKWNLDVKHIVFKHWSDVMEKFTNQVRGSTLFGDMDECQLRWAAAVQVIVPNDDARMHDIIACMANSDALVSAEQLITPVTTPGVELFLSPRLLAEDAPSCVALPVVEDHVLAKASDVHHCPYFDEFIQSTPRDVFTDRLEAAVVRGAEAPELHYATPESMRMSSPSSTAGAESSSHSPAQAGGAQEAPAEVCPAFALAAPLVLPDTTLHLPPTPAMRSYPSFSLLPDVMAVEEARSLKRTRAEAQFEHSTQSASASSLGKRVKRGV